MTHALEKSRPISQPDTSAIEAAAAFNGLTPQGSKTGTGQESEQGNQRSRQGHAMWAAHLGSAATAWKSCYSKKFLDLEHFSKPGGTEDRYK